MLKHSLCWLLVGLLAIQQKKVYYANKERDLGANIKSTTSYIDKASRKTALDSSKYDDVVRIAKCGQTQITNSPQMICMMMMMTRTMAKVTIVSATKKLEDIDREPRPQPCKNWQRTQTGNKLSLKMFFWAINKIAYFRRDSVPLKERYLPTPRTTQVCRRRREIIINTTPSLKNYEQSKQWRRKMQNKTSNSLNGLIRLFCHRFC